MFNNLSNQIIVNNFKNNSKNPAGGNETGNKIVPK